MFLKKDTLTVGSETATLYELSALQRAEYFEYLAGKEAVMSEGTSSFQKTAQMMRLNIEANAWMVSRSLWHGSTERDENDLHQEVMRTWPTEALSLAVEMVMALSGMTQKNPEPHEEGEQTVVDVEERPLEK